jgi:hypothetical protein
MTILIDFVIKMMNYDKIDEGFRILMMSILVLTWTPTGDGVLLARFQEFVLPIPFSIPSLQSISLFIP